jgi:hypothetical protein
LLTHTLVVQAFFMQPFFPYSFFVDTLVVHALIANLLFVHPLLARSFLLQRLFRPPLQRFFPCDVLTRNLPLIARRERLHHSAAANIAVAVASKPRLLETHVDCGCRRRKQYRRTHRSQRE